MFPVRMLSLTGAMALLTVLHACSGGGESGPALSSLPAITAQPPYTYTIISKNGGRVDWSPDGKQIAYDRLEKDGFYDIRLMDEGGNDLGCLTCDHPQLPNRDIGQPAWHPSGRYLVFQAEKSEHPRVRFRNVTAPGAGIYNDIWIMEIATREVVLLHEIATASTAAVLHPHFSADGARLSWGELYGESNLLRRGAEIGLWKLNVAPFIEDEAGVRLGEIDSFVPGTEGWYENHGFSPDGALLLFAGCYEKGVPVYLANIYAYDLATRKATRLTDAGYNEHALFSPDGATIAWMTNLDVPKAESGVRGTEFWRMRADGSRQERLTYFNTVTLSPQKESVFVAADSSWAPQGDRFVGYMHVVSSAAEVISATEGEFWNVIVDVPKR